MKFFGDIRSSRVLVFKGVLFAGLAVLAGVLTVMLQPLWQRSITLVLCAWAACRFYYFLFYVLERYVGGVKNASVFSMIVKALRRENKACESQSAVECGNLFADLPAAALPEEVIENLVVADGVRVERILSTGQASPDGFWYDQAEHEWVAVLAGEAVLEFRENGVLTETRRMIPGDYVFIPAHREHRVASTAADGVTVWLAVFMK